MPRTSNARERIIAVLAQSPRRRIEDIAELVELARQNCSRYVNQLVQEGIVAKGYCLIRAPAAYTLIGGPKENVSDDQVEMALRAATCVSSYHAITGGKYNYIAHVDTAIGSEEFQKFIMGLRKIVRDTETFVHIGDLKAR